MNWFQKYLVEEFAEDYQEGHLSHPEALKMITAVSGNQTLAKGMLADYTPQSEASTGVPRNDNAVIPSTGGSATRQDDPEIRAAEIQFQGQEATLTGYLASPATAGPFPIVLVCHENRGLTPHIQDVTRRVAREGYLAIAVDLLARAGGTASLSSTDVPGILGNYPPEQFVQDFRAGLDYARRQPGALQNPVGMMGFCFGGGVTWLCAARIPDIKAAVPFYGPPPPLEEIPNIRAAVLAIYGENDQRINRTIPEVEAAMQAAGKAYEKVIYASADHAFFNDTGQHYNPPAARDAWKRTLEWFGRYLREG